MKKWRKERLTTQKYMLCDFLPVLTGKKQINLYRYIKKMFCKKILIIV